MSYTIPITGSYICHNCATITWGVHQPTCEECHSPLLSVQKMHDRDTARARAIVAKCGVGKGMPIEQRTQRAPEARDVNQHLTAFLTAREAA